MGVLSINNIKRMSILKIKLTEHFFTYVSSTSPYPSPAHYTDKQALLQHQQKPAAVGHPQVRGETALARLQSRVSQGDVQNLVVQPEEQQSATVSFESPILQRLASQQSVKPGSPAKMRWKNLKQQTASHIGDAARAVKEELTNTSSGAIDTGAGGGQEPNGTASVVSNTGQPTRSTRRPRRPPPAMGPQLVQAQRK